MRKIHVIGTLHNMLPKYKKEFLSVLEEINPDQILVEMDQKNIKTKRWKRHPREMIFAYQWAINNKKKVSGFDIDMDIVKRPMPRKIMKEYFRNFNRLSKKVSWKEWNKRKYDFIDNKWSKLIINPQKDAQREKIMLKNVRKNILKKGKILIITGCGHLLFFEKHLPEAIFLFRT